MRKVSIYLILAIVLLSHVAIAQQIFHFGVGYGSSSIFGNDAASWKSGFYISGKAAYQLSSLFQIGASVSYHSFSPDMAEIRSIYAGGISFNGSFSRSYLELIPYVSFYPLKSKFGIYFLVGAGLVISQKMIDVDYTYSYVYSINRYQYQEDSHKPYPAIMVGTGFYFPIFGNFSLEIKLEARYVGDKSGFPVYSKTIFSGSGHKYFSIGLGFNY